MERTLKPCRMQSLTWWILEERDDEEKECWREGGGMGGRGVRSSVYMTMESKWWYFSALEQTVIQTTLINFSTFLPSHSSRLFYRRLYYNKNTSQQLWPVKRGFSNRYVVLWLDLPALAAWLSEQAEAGFLETHHFPKWSIVLLGCIIKISLWQPLRES